MESWAIALGSAALATIVTYLLMRIVVARSETAAGRRESSLQARASELEQQLEKREAELKEARKQATLSAEEAARVITDLEGQLRALEEQVEFVGEAREALTESFKSLASDALRSNNQSFLHLAHETLNRYQESAKSDLDARGKAIQELVGPVKDVLARVDGKIEDVEKRRSEAYGGLTRYLRSLTESQARLELETGRLVKALRTPNVRGRWGELQLKRVVEMAGMLEHCDFHQQPTLEGSRGRSRPDLVIRLPGRRTVVVDSKAPLHHYLEALDADTEEARTAALRNHAKQVKRHLHELGSKAYWDQLDNSPAFVVLFLPGEAFFSAALGADPSLLEYGNEKGVIPATPTTLIALLKIVAYGWRQEQLAESAREISALGQELSGRLSTFVGHFDDMKKGLDRAVRGYNRAVGSLETRVLVSARRFEELGAGGVEEISSPEPIERATRHLMVPDHSE